MGVLPILCFHSLQWYLGDWMLLLLQKLNETLRLVLLMVLWRVCIHNELTHQKPLIPVEVSKRFLCGYAESLLSIKYFPHADATKGKLPAMTEGNFAPVMCVTKHFVTPAVWKPPPEG